MKRILLPNGHCIPYHDALKNNPDVVIFDDTESRVEFNENGEAVLVALNDSKVAKNAKRGTRRKKVVKPTGIPQKVGIFDHTADMPLTSDDEQ